MAIILPESSTTSVCPIFLFFFSYITNPSLSFFLFWTIWFPLILPWLHCVTHIGLWVQVSGGNGAANVSALWNCLQLVNSCFRQAKPCYKVLFWIPPFISSVIQHKFLSANLNKKIPNCLSIVYYQGSHWYLWLWFLENIFSKTLLNVQSHIIEHWTLGLGSND